MPRSPVSFAVSILNQFYWVGASTVGALLGAILPINTEGLDFALTALFVVLAVEQVKQVRSPLPPLIAAVCAIAALVLTGPQHMLIVAILSSAAALLLFRKRLS